MLGHWLEDWMLPKQDDEIKIPCTYCTQSRWKWPSHKQEVKDRLRQSCLS